MQGIGDMLLLHLQVSPLCPGPAAGVAREEKDTQGRSYVVQGTYLFVAMDHAAHSAADCMVMEKLII